MTTARREPRTLLEHLIQQRDNTYEELADEIGRTGERVPISARHLGRLARGERGMAGTNPATRRALQAMFSLPVEELLRPWSPADVPTVRNHEASSTGLIVVDVDRSVLTMAADRARRFTLNTAQATAPEFIEQLRSDVARLALAYPQRPVTDLLGDLVETQELLFTLLERQQPLAQARQLHFLAAVTSGLLAKASQDSGEPHAAMIQARTAILCADQADHAGLRAWLRGLQSLVAYWAGRYREALRYAEQGSSFVADAGGTTAVWLPLSAARAHAALGNAEQAILAIRGAEGAWDRVSVDELDELGGICVFNQPRTLYYAADALAWLPGQADDAIRYSTSAVDAFSNPNDPSWAFGDQAGAHANLAIARLADHNVGGAEEAIAPVLDLPPEQRINGIIQSVLRVQAAVIRAGLAQDAAGLVDAIEAFTRTPLKAITR
ncbi:hypothetical protein [Dactylosporangium sp. NPDC005555]|uniref:hypothetical protein n=1 Tax=Dactylosporangium sp. NPDC005555 TaxID=3154889 RepID=UPI0033A09A3D